MRNGISPEVARDGREAAPTRDEASVEAVRLSSAGERVSRKNRVVDDHFLGLTAQEAEQFVLLPNGIAARLAVTEPVEPMASLVAVPKAVVSHRQEGPVESLFRPVTCLLPTGRPVAASQSSAIPRVAPIPLSVRTVLPSGLNATEVTSFRCTITLPMSHPVLASQSPQCRQGSR